MELEQHLQLSLLHDLGPATQRLSGGKGLKAPYPCGPGMLPGAKISMRSCLRKFAAYCFIDLGFRNVQGSSGCFRKALTRVGSETTDSVPVCTSSERCTPALPPGSTAGPAAGGIQSLFLLLGVAVLHLPAGHFRARCHLGDEVSPLRFCAAVLVWKIQLLVACVLPASLCIHLL